ncbi:MAG: Npt1/Npt2 family nucleotide transporter [Parachlamydiales bacterium]
MSDGSIRRLLSKTRSILFPVERHELIRVLPMCLLSFGIVFIYNILRCVKDSMLITAPNSGTHALPFAKIWVLLPMAFFLSAVFYKLSHRLTTTKLFYAIICGFLAFFALFTFVLYPLGDTIHLHGLADWLQGHLPSGLIGMIAVIRYWSYALFYVMAELWGAMCLTVLFWGYASEITKIEEAKRFYSLFAISANLSGCVAGWCTMAFVKATWGSSNPHYHSLLLTTLAVLGTGVALLFLFRWYHFQVVSPRMEVSQVGIDRKLKKMRSKASLLGSFAHISRSKYLLSIATVAVAYNIVIYLVEVAWKEHVKMVYSDKALYNAYFGQVTIVTSIVSTVMALFTSYAIRRFGWTRVALVTPIVLLITSLGFFGLQYLSGYSVSTVAAIFGMSAANFILFFGSAQNVMSRASKYTVFDATKEMCFIPMSKESRLQGKAAIDGVGSRLGKSGGAAIYQAMFLLSGKEVAAIIPWIGGMLVVILGGWIIAVRNLGRHFAKAERDHIDVVEEVSLPEPERQTV